MPEKRDNPRATRVPPSQDSPESNFRGMSAPSSDNEPPRDNASLKDEGDVPSTGQSLRESTQADAEAVPS